MTGPQPAPVWRPDENAPAEADLAGGQAGSHAAASGAERTGKRGRRRVRRGIVALLVAVSCLLVVLSATVVWAHRTVLDTPAFVGTVGPVFQHPAVDSAVAARAAGELVTGLGLQARLRAALPARAGFAAVPITNATRSFVAGELAKVLASPRFQAVWTGALTRTHQQLVAVLRGQHAPAVSASGGYIVLNTVPVIGQALAKAPGLVFELTGKRVTLPAITSADVPRQAVAKLSRALGVPLPASFGQITLVRSSDLATVRQAVRAFDGLTLVLPLVTIALIALCLWLSVNRRRTVLQLAVGVSLLMIVERRVVLHEQGVLAGGAHDPPLASAVLGDLLHGFFVLTAWVLGVALVVVVIAVLAGPYRWAAAIRSSVRRAGRGIAGATSGDRRGVTAWMGSHAAGLQLAGAVVAAILLLIVTVSWVSFLTVGVLLAAYEVFLQQIKPPRADEEPAAPGPGNQLGPRSRNSQT